MRYKQLNRMELAHTIKCLLPTERNMLVKMFKFVVNKQLERVFEFYVLGDNFKEMIKNTINTELDLKALSCPCLLVYDALACASEALPFLTYKNLDNGMFMVVFNEAVLKIMKENKDLLETKDWEVKDEKISMRKAM